jgi:hypothetical protein
MAVGAGAGAAARRVAALAALIAGFARPGAGWSVTIEKPEDMVCTLADGTPTHGMTGPVVGTLGGAPNLRSGPPDGVCRVKLPAPAPISTVSMDYRYLTGCEYSAAQCGTAQSAACMVTLLGQAGGTARAVTAR